VERGIDRIDGDGALTYRVEGDAPQVGERVQVHLGSSRTPTPGVVVCVGGPELLERLDPRRVKPLTRANGARLSESLVTLARWMSDYYVAPLGLVLAGMMPAAVKSRAGERRVERVELVSPAPPPEGLSVASRKALKRLTELAGVNWPVPLKELAGLAGYRSIAPLRRLVIAGVLRSVTTDEIRASSLPNLTSAPDHARDDAFTLSDEQRTAIDGIRASSSFGVHVLRGVTGSGKTEVYLRLIAHALASGKRAIVLVPEIALTPQTTARFTSRFGHERVAVIHSGLTPAQRHREWAKASSGAADIVVGARSAVFAPVENLGLIVVDEEHDGSYKQDRVPRYNARDVAVKRAQLAGCPAVLGSATPSLETWANASAGRYQMWTLHARVAGAMLPRVEIVDLREERRERARSGDGQFHLLGPRLESAIERTLTQGGQVILLLNRRGMASYVWCRSAACGFVLQCDQCDASLVVHRAGEAPGGSIVRCHHCDAAQRVPSLCPACSGKLSLFGWGTQRAEEELERKFGVMGIHAGTSLLRLDSDEMRSAHDFAAALSRFASGEVRMLVGTQMLAKGLDYPNVRLVGVIDADTSLNIPDFRASERTFQLVSQVAGRAGRGQAPGEVILQTLNPREPAIVLAAEHDYVSFARLELASRARFGLPPTTRMARIVCRDESADTAHASASELADRLRADGLVAVRGPMPCAISRVAGHYRFVVEVLGQTAGEVGRALRALRNAGVLRSDARTAVDVDPVSGM